MQGTVTISLREYKELTETFEKDVKQEFKTNTSSEKWVEYLIQFKKLETTYRTATKSYDERICKEFNLRDENLRLQDRNANLLKITEYSILEFIKYKLNNK